MSICLVRVEDFLSLRRVEKVGGSAVVMDSSYQHTGRSFDRPALSSAYGVARDGAEQTFALADGDNQIAGVHLGEERIELGLSLAGGN